MQTLSAFIMHIYQVQIQARLFHYQSMRYGQHVAFGEFYDEFSSLTDQIIENLIGKYGRPVIAPVDNSISVLNMSEISPDAWVASIGQIYRSVKEDFDSSADSDVVNLLEEVLAEIDKLQYKLTLA
jgi:DNA-binding ferritin-like protein